MCPSFWLLELRARKGHKHGKSKARISNLEVVINMLIYCHLSLKRLLTVAYLLHTLQNADFFLRNLTTFFFFFSIWLPTHPLLPYSSVVKKQKSGVLIAKLHPSKSFNCYFPFTSCTPSCIKCRQQGKAYAVSKTWII